MLHKIALVVLDKTIMGLWVAVGFSVVLLFSTLFYGGVGGAGWMGFVYIGTACLSFMAIRMLRIAQEWIETPTLEEI